MNCLMNQRHNRAMRCLLAMCCSAVVALVALTSPFHEALADDDADRAREGVESGLYVPLEDIVRSARLRYPGRVVEVELDDDEYEIEILQEDGTKIELEYDARTGELLEADVDD